MSRFRRSGDTIVCTLHKAEYALITHLHDDLRSVVTDQDPTDRRFQRLFPPTVLNSVEPSTSDEVEIDDLPWRDQAIVTRADWLASASRHRGMVRLEIAVADIDQLLQLINDVRLMVGASIDIDAFDRDMLDAADDRQHALAVIDHLAWWQEELLVLLDDDPDATV